MPIHQRLSEKLTASAHPYGANGSYTYLPRKKVCMGMPAEPSTVGMDRAKQPDA